jgi:hypothetical protein
LPQFLYAFLLSFHIFHDFSHSWSQMVDSSNLPSCLPSLFLHVVNLRRNFE